MSISVTVNGNPVNIQRGRMVTASPNRSKKEFEKRRLIRLSQVRQQAKSIAEEVRNKVRQEQLKQSEEQATEGKQKLKQWQSRKLLELQNQYYESLGAMGTGHKQAEELEDEELLSKKKEMNDKIAKKRGVSAGKILLEEKAKRAATIPIARKKPEKFEVRKHMKDSIKRSVGSRIRNTDQLSTVTDVSGVVTESDIEYEDVPEISADQSINKIESPQDTVTVKINGEVLAGNSGLDNIENLMVPNVDEQLSRQKNEPKDTRISDRIRKRSNKRINPSDVCDTLASASKEIIQEDNSKRYNKEPLKKQQSMFQSTQQNIYTCTCNTPMATITMCQCADSVTKSQQPFLNKGSSEHILRSQKPNSKTHISAAQKKSTITPPKPRIRHITAEIPTKPKVTLKSIETVPQQKINESASPKFLNTHVEKINDDNLITSAEHRAHNNSYEKIRQRDEEAIIRGQKALQREKLQREYDKLIKKLPALQKLERMYKMNQDRPEYHMTEERLQEQEKKKQGILDNTYERLFPERRSPAITIPVKNIHKVDKQDSYESADLNLNLWDTERRTRKLYTEDEVEAILREGKVPSESRFRTDQLKLVLEKLRKRKDELLREIPNFQGGNENLSTILSFSPSKDTVYNKTQSNIDIPVKRKSESKIKKAKVPTEKSERDKPMGSNVESNVQNSSSYETVDECTENASKPKKNMRKASKTDQSKYKSNIVLKKGTADKTNLRVRKVAIKRKQEKEYSSEQSASELIIPRKSSRNSSSDHPNKKKLKQVELLAPTNSVVSAAELDKKSKNATFVSCNCQKESEQKNLKELCEIVIKIKDHKSSQISINGRKEKVNEDLPVKTTQKQEQKLKVKDDCCQGNEDIARFHSWHEKFSKNNSQLSNTSTSYLSPPVLPNKLGKHSEAPPYFCDLIGEKPKQLNLSDISLSPPTKLPSENRNVFNDIKRLLKMSHLSIDDLGVSSVSTVTTPSQSLIDMESNKIVSQPFSTFSKKSPKYNQGSVLNGSSNSSQLIFSSDNRSTATTELENGIQNHPDVLNKYAKIAEKCSQRISNLTAMIEKVREEKNKMLQNPSLLSNDASTRYMDLPNFTRRNDEKDSRIDSKSPSSGGSNEGKALLEIDFSLAEKLKGLNPEEISNYGSSTISNKTNTNDNEEYLEKRLKALRAPMPAVGKEKTTEKLNKEPLNENSVEYVQFLLDIPRLPPLTTDLLNSKQRKPPPCKSFLAARKFAEDFPKPHELSTIPEQDSQTRLESTLREKSLQATRERKKSEKNISDKSSKIKEVSVHSGELYENKEREKIVAESEKNRMVNEKTLKVTPKKVATLNLSDNSLGSSIISAEEKVDLFGIEAMLRSIGMDWAISTLRKTQEALALTSSSSSIEMRSPIPSKKLEDTDLKKFLSRKMLQKISSSTLKSDLSPSSLDGSHDFSEIKKSDFAMKQTSTPINRSNDTCTSREKSMGSPSSIETEKSSNMEFVSLPENSP